MFFLVTQTLYVHRQVQLYFSLPHILPTGYALSYRNYCIPKQLHNNWKVRILLHYNYKLRTAYWNLFLHINKINSIAAKASTVTHTIT